MELDRLQVCVPGQTETHLLRPEGTGDGDGDGGQGGSRSVSQVKPKHLAAPSDMPPFAPGTWMACDWAYCLSVCVRLCMDSAGTGLPPSTSRPGTMRWKTTLIPTPTSAIPGVQSAAPGPCAPTTPRWDSSEQQTIKVQEKLRNRKVILHFRNYTGSCSKSGKLPDIIVHNLRPTF